MRGGSNRLLSAAEAAEILGVTRNWLYENWRSIGLRSVKVGSSRKFAEREIQAWIERNTSSG